MWLTRLFGRPLCRILSFVSPILVLESELVGIPKAMGPLLTLPVLIPLLVMVRFMAMGRLTMTLRLCTENVVLGPMAMRRHRLLVPLLPTFGPFPLVSPTPRLLPMFVGMRVPNPPLLMDRDMAVFPIVRCRARSTPEPWLLLPLGCGVLLQLQLLVPLHVRRLHLSRFVLLLNTEKTLPTPPGLLFEAEKWTCELPLLVFRLNTELKTLEKLEVLKLLVLELLVKWVLFTLNR